MHCYDVRFLFVLAWLVAGCGGGGLPAGGDSDMASGNDRSCCRGGQPGNERGVGKSCAAQADCTNAPASVCTALGGTSPVGFCTMECSHPFDCGSDAACDCSMIGLPCFCLPPGCDTMSC
jgi:hypothetical protein